MKNKIDNYSKKEKTYLIFSIIFLSLSVISTVCFVVFANYKIQVLMTVLGCVISSLLATLFVGFYCLGYLQNKAYLNFYKQLENKEEESIKGEITLSCKFYTLRKRLSFFIIYIKDTEFYVLDEKLYKRLKNGNNYECKVIDNYVLEINGCE
jgi:hypothetical protein